MQQQATLPGMFAPVQGVLAIEPAVPATKKTNRVCKIHSG